MILGLLGRQNKRLFVVVVLDQLAVLAGDDGARHLVLVLAKHRDLEEHRSDVMDALERLQVNRHVGRDETALLLKLLLCSLLLMTVDSLGKKLSEPGALEDLNEHLV